MNDNKVKKTSLVFAYGCGDPTAGIEQALQEMELRRNLWDELVTIDRVHDRRMDDEISQSVQEVANLNKCIETVSREIDDLVTERRAIRKQAKKRVGTPAIDEALTHLFAKRDQLRRDRLELVKAWKRSHPERVKALMDDRKQAVPKCRTRQELWCNYNDVIDRYRVAKDLAGRKGRRPKLYDRTREDGVLALQFQGGASLAELMSGKKQTFMYIEPIDKRAWCDQVPRGDRRRLCRTMVSWRINRAGDKLVLPLYLDRPLPEGAVVKAAQLTWKREGAQIRWQLCLTLNLPAWQEPRLPAAAKACGIDVGWRQDGAAGLLVATLYDSDGKVERLHLPERWMKLQDRVEAGSSRLRKSFNRCRAWCVRFAPELVEAFDGGEYRSIHNAIMARRVPRLLAWRRRHKRLHDIVEATRAKQIRRRREVYRVWACQIVERYGLVRIEDIDLSKLAKVKEHELAEWDLPPQARAQRQRACVSQLLDNIRHQANKQSVLLEAISGKSTQLCNECGEVTSEPPDRASRRWQCDHCDAIWDRDINAAKNLCLTDASGPVLQRAAG